MFAQRCDRPRQLAACFAAACSLLAAPGEMLRAAEPQSADIVVYGGTAGGIVAAITARKLGASVVILEPSEHVGGMVTGGLGFTDTGLKPTIGGMAADFHRRLYAHYEKPESWKHQTREDFLMHLKTGQQPTGGKWWVFEPSAGAGVLQDMLDEVQLKVLTGHRLANVTKQGGRITHLQCDHGAVFSGRVFIDATYEGDLMATAGVSYAVGRESSAQYDEPLAGVVPRALSTRNQIDVDVDPYDADGKLIYGVQQTQRGADGAADRKVQAYNYRLCLTDVPANRVAITMPDDYDPARYELFVRYLAAKPDLKLTDLLGMIRVPNRKTDLNNRGAVSTDFIGMNWDYPDGDAARRREIVAEHIAFTKGLLYFLGHDKRVPKRIRDDMLAWGYPADEFLPTGGFPPQLYVREARRMSGAYVMTSHDLTTNQEKPDTVGLASYKPDSHHLQRIVEEGHVRNEGNPNDATHGARAYEVPYRALTPKSTECDNLLVTFCVSASHMSFSSLRMEPVFMILSQSAATAAVQAVREDCAVQDCEITSLQRALREQGQLLTLKDFAASRKQESR